MAFGILLGIVLGSFYRGSSNIPVISVRTDSRPCTSVEDLQLADNTLVIYSFYDGDEVSWGNLLFFVEHAVAADDGAQYVIVLNGGPSLDDPRLPELPVNGKYVLHSNECYDWGTYTWVMKNVVDTKPFTYIIFINSSVRGPLLPWHSRAQHWTRLFTGKINDKVKLVGPAISCEHFCISEPTKQGPRRSCRKNAHVQSVAVATDQVGLSVLMQAGYVLRCHENRFHAVFYGEIGASLAILEAGYTIDSFLMRYQDIDWNDKANWECNSALSPIGKRTFDGVTVSALEAVFPKLKGSLLESGLPSHFEALKMSEWLSSKPSARNITHNWYATEGDSVRAEDILVALHKGEKCFDWDFYKVKNGDVASLPQSQMWRHFLTRGAVEFREHRWKCSLDIDEVMAHV